MSSGALPSSSSCRRRIASADDEGSVGGRVAGLAKRRRRLLEPVDLGRVERVRHRLDLAPALLGPEEALRLRRADGVSYALRELRLVVLHTLASSVSIKLWYATAPLLFKSNVKMSVRWICAWFKGSDWGIVVLNTLSFRGK